MKVALKADVTVVGKGCKATHSAGLKVPQKAGTRGDDSFAWLDPLPRMSAFPSVVRAALAAAP